MSAQPTVAALVADARRAAGLSLTGAVAALSARGLTLAKQHLCDIEHGRRRLLPAHWKAFCAVLPTLALGALARAAVAEGPVEVDGRRLSDTHRWVLAGILARSIEAGP